MSANPPVTVTFTVEPGQVWIDPHGVAWRVSAITAHTAQLERTVVETRYLRDLVRVCRQPDDEINVAPLETEDGQ